MESKSCFFIIIFALPQCDRSDASGMKRSVISKSNLMVDKHHSSSKYVDVFGRFIIFPFSLLHFEEITASQSPIH